MKSFVRAILRPPVLAVDRVGNRAGVWIRRLRMWLLCNGVETPFDITASIAGGAVLLTWHGDSTNVGVYVVERSEDRGPYHIRLWVGAGALPGVHSFAWADTNIDLGGRYCYRITAQHTDGSRGCPADPVCINGCNGLPTPLEVMGIAWGEHENRLGWKCDATNVAQYRIERRTDVAVGFQPHAIVPAGTQPGVQHYSYSDHDVQGGVFYCYRIASTQADDTLGCFTDPVCMSLVYF